MISHRRHEFATSNHLSFTVPLRANEDPDRSDEADFINWAEGIKAKYNFGKADGNKSGAWARRSPLSYNHGCGGEEFRWLAKDDSEMDIPSPRMWDQAGSPTMARSPKHHQPTLRAQLIARYRQEMLDLVRDVPESAYELSLKDLVELPRSERVVEEAPAKNRGREIAKKGATRTPRSRSMNTGVFLLKMFFPFYVGGKKRRSNSSSSRSGGPCSKVTPKPVGALERSTDAELWNKNEFGDSRSSSSGSSNSSIIISSSRKLRGCYSFFHTHRSKNQGDLTAIPSKQNLTRY